MIKFLYFLIRHRRDVLIHRSELICHSAAIHNLSQAASFYLSRQGKTRGDIYSQMRKETYAGYRFLIPVRDGYKFTWISDSNGNPGKTGYPYQKGMENIYYKDIENHIVKVYKMNSVLAWIIRKLLAEELLLCKLRE